MASTKTITVTATAPFAQGDIKSDPNPAHVHKADTTIVFQVGSGSTAGVVFKGLTAEPSEQLSPISISDGGQQMTLTDVDNAKEKIHYTLHMSDASGRAFTHDPQIINNPRPT